MADGTNWRDVIRDSQATGAALQPRVEVVEDKYDARSAYFEVQRTDDKGSAQIIRRVPPRIRKYEVLSIAGLVQMIGAFAVRKPAEKEGRATKDSGPITAPGPRKFVFVNDQGAQVLLDEADGHETLWLEFRETKQFEMLRAIEGGRGVDLSQQGVIDLLRRDLNGQYTPDGIVPLLRKLKFARKDDAESELKSTKSSMSKAVTAEVTGAADLPEEITAEVPIFSNVRDIQGFLYTAKVTLCLDVDLFKERFSLRLKAGELDRVMEQTRFLIAQQIEIGVCDLQNVRVFVGHPEAQE